MSALRPHILIADSEMEVREALAQQAKALGLTYVTAGNVDEALNMARSLLPSVIVLDVSRQLEGRDLMAALSRDEKTAHIRWVVLSAEEDQNMRHTCFKLGAADYAVKPADPLFIKRVARKAKLEARPTPPDSLSP